MEKVRVGIIGMGNMGRYHANCLLDGNVARCELVAVCSTSPHKLDDYKAKGVAVFGDGEELIRSGKIDAVIVATPHYQHTSLGILALEQGLHIMIEKPISAHKADAERLIAAAEKHPKLVFGAMFQLRSEPRYKKMKKLIDAGELGDLVRVNWIITDWYRTESYYQSGGWRATWKGEGGGVLINQCLHNLDSLQWLCGMPNKVRSFAQIGRYHDIEVEDNVTAYLEWENGATGVFVTSSGEAPGTNRFEIAGTKGKIVLENDTVTFTRNEEDMVSHCKTSEIGFIKPDVWNVDIPITNAELPHAQLMNDFVEAILDDSPLRVPGAEGLHSIELANVMLYSSLIGATVELPMDAAAFEAKLEELIAGSKHEKKVKEVSADDFAKSFNR
jgi:predicted dehydrogenase